MNHIRKSTQSRRWKSLSLQRWCSPWCLVHNILSLQRCGGTSWLRLTASGQLQMPSYRGRLSDTALSLTFGAQTGRRSDRSCVIKRTLDPEYQPLISCVHQLAQNAAGSALPYLGIQILKLGEGQQLNQQRDYHNHPDYPNHTMKFGKYAGGSLQMLRYGTWHSYDIDCQWLSFDALKFVHRVQPVTSGSRYSITLYTPGKLERLTAQDWDILAKAGFPIYLYERFQLECVGS